MPVKNTTKNEWIMYASIWLVMFLAPLISVYAHSVISDNIQFRIQDVFHLWDGIFVMLVIFLLHNHFLAPRLINNRDVKLYVIGTIVLIASFSLYSYIDTPPPPPVHTGQYIEKMVDSEGDTLMVAFPSKNWKNKKGQVPPIELVGDKNLEKYNDRPPFSPNDLLLYMLLTFILASNLGLKFYFKNLDSDKRKQELEKEVLQQELSYLKYQVNPHFLMNTLNNIHAMVDIDPEKAKSGIVKLSQLLRYMLYEGSKTTIPLNQGIMFMKCYIDLMSARYDNVDINFDVPDPVPNVEVLPLLVITFLENAFKHGVSYIEPSFIHVSIDVKDNHLLFNCVNSKHNCNKSKDIDHAGFGIANAQKRLDLIFGDNYDLNIDDSTDTYSVKLSFPLDVVKQLN